MSTENASSDKPDGRKLICSAGRHVFEQGTPAHHAYHIDEGRVEIIIQEGAHSVRIAELGPGEVFGEMGILEDRTRMASVIALEHCVITVISRKDFEERIAAVSDPFIRSLIQGLTRRLRESANSQVKYFKDLAHFQDRVGRLMEKAQNGINQSRRDEFMNEVMPLLEQMEDLLDRYNK